MMSKFREAQQRIVLSEAHRDYGKGLRQHSFYKLNNSALSGDLVQDTFTKTWSYLVKGGKIETMKAFLYHVLNNLIVDEYRKRKTLSLDLLQEKGFEPAAINTKESFFEKIDSEVVIGLINQLPDKYKAVIKMRFIKDLSLKEMSLITGKTQNALAVQVHRGLAKLKELYLLKMSKKDL